VIFEAQEAMVGKIRSGILNAQAVMEDKVNDPADRIDNILEFALFSLNSLERRITTNADDVSNRF
jgi:hypothetical protein